VGSMVIVVVVVVGGCGWWWVEWGAAVVLWVGGLGGSGLPYHSVASAPAACATDVNHSPMHDGDVAS